MTDSTFQTIMVIGTVGLTIAIIIILALIKLVREEKADEDGGPWWEEDE